MIGTAFLYSSTANSFSPFSRAFLTFLIEVRIDDRIEECLCLRFSACLARFAACLLFANIYSLTLCSKVAYYPYSDPFCQPYAATLTRYSYNNCTKE